MRRLVVGVLVVIGTIGVLVGLYWLKYPNYTYR